MKNENEIRKKIFQKKMKMKFEKKFLKMKNENEIQKNIFKMKFKKDFLGEKNSANYINSIQKLLSPIFILKRI